MTGCVYSYPLLFRCADPAECDGPPGSVLRDDSRRMVHARESFQLRYRNQNAPANSPEFQLSVCQQIINRPDAQRESDCGLLAANQQFCVRWHRHFGGRLFRSLPTRACRSRLLHCTALRRRNLAVGPHRVYLSFVISLVLNRGRLRLNGIRQLVLRDLVRLQETL